MINFDACHLLNVYIIYFNTELDSNRVNEPIKHFRKQTVEVVEWNLRNEMNVLTDTDLIDNDLKYTSTKMYGKIDLFIDDNININITYKMRAIINISL